MSVYIVSNETIAVIAKGIVEYGIEVPVKFDGMALMLVNECYQPVGQWLLNQNYASVNHRYNETTETPVFEYKEPEQYNEGILFGCLRCWNYQACETPNYEKSEFASMVERLQYEMLNRMIINKGYEIPWGYEELNHKPQF